MMIITRMTTAILATAILTTAILADTERKV